MLEQQMNLSLEKEISNLTDNIDFTHNSDGLLLTFNSKLFKNIKGIPIIAIKEDMDLSEFISKFDIQKETEEISEEVKDLMEFYNERRLFFTETDKQIVKDEVLQAVSDLYKGILNKKGSQSH